jgi:phosphotransferase system HPr-like phosphotransfer protein
VLLRIDRDGEGADCASILDVLALALACGDTVRLEAKGERAEAALAAAAGVLARRDDP